MCYGTEFFIGFFLPQGVGTTVIVPASSLGPSGSAGIRLWVCPVKRRIFRMCTRGHIYILVRNNMIKETHHIFNILTEIKIATCDHFCITIFNFTEKKKKQLKSFNMF